MGNVSAKILRKKVDDGSFGTKRYSFMIAYQGENKWVSAFADPKKMPPDVIETLRGLGEGDRAEFALVENPSKDGQKVYLNIVGVVRETQLREDEASPVEIPSGGKKVEHRDSRDEMMRMSYCKDLMIAFPDEGEADLMGRVVIVKNMAKLMGE